MDSIDKNPRSMAVVVWVLIVGLNLVLYQNCDSAPSNGLDISSQCTGSDCTTKAGCGAGMWRPTAGSSCVAVGDQYYSPENNDRRYSCPIGASSAGTSKANIRDCLPVVLLNTTQGDCSTNMTDIPSSVNVIFGCIRGAVLSPDTTPSPTSCACSDIDGVTCESIIAGCDPLNPPDGKKVPNAQWVWDPALKAYVTPTGFDITAFGMRGKTLYQHVKREDGVRNQMVPVRFQ